MATEQFDEYEIKDVVCYLLSDVHKKYINYWTDKQKIKSVLASGNIPKDKYWTFKYVEKTEEYVPCKETYTKSHAFIEKQWCEDNIMKPEYHVLYKSSIIESKYKPVPELIELDENEVIILEDGTEMIINVYGEREYNKCYIRVSELAEKFNAKNIEKVLTNSTSSFEENYDYVYFCEKNVDSKFVSIDDEKGVTIKQVIFLTYHGFLHYCFTAVNKHAKLMSKWITSIVQTHHIGSMEQKGEKACSLLGISKKYSNVLHSFTVPVSGVYLFLLSTVRELKSKIPDKYLNKYADDMLVCKFGHSSNIRDRFNNINNTHKDLIIDKQLLCVAQTDVTKEVESENELKRIFKELECMFEYDNHKELIVINKNLVKTIVEYYKNIGERFAHTYQSYNNSIRELQDALKKQELNATINNLTHDNEILKYEKEILDLKAKNEILELKYQLLEQKIK